MYDIKLINYCLNRKGVSFASIAKELGVGKSAITNSLKRGNTRSKTFKAIEQKYRELYGTDLPKLEDPSSNLLAA
jgi:IS30 family transposase